MPHELMRHCKALAVWLFPRLHFPLAPLAPPLSTSSCRPLQLHLQAGKGLMAGKAAALEAAARARCQQDAEVAALLRLLRVTVARLTLL